MEYSFPQPMLLKQLYIYNHIVVYITYIGIIIVYNETVDKYQYPDVLSWQDLMQIGKQQKEDDLQER